MDSATSSLFSDASIRPASSMSALSPKADPFNDDCYVSQLLRTASPEFP